MLPPPHHPPHIYLDNTWYMITGSIYRKRHLLKPESHKELIRDQIMELKNVYRFNLAAWVILDNHYHLLIKSHIGKQLTRFIARLHGRTSFELNGRDHARGRQVWHNYWDTCMRTDSDLWTHFNYIHHNPVKLGYVISMEEWRFSSCQYYCKQKGEEWLEGVFRQYPIIDFTDPNDEF